MRQLHRPLENRRQGQASIGLSLARRRCRIASHRADGNSAQAGERGADLPRARRSNPARTCDRLHEAAPPALLRDRASSRLFGAERLQPGRAPMDRSIPARISRASRPHLGLAAPATRHNPPCAAISPSASHTRRDAPPVDGSTDHIVGNGGQASGRVRTNNTSIPGTLRTARLCGRRHAHGAF
jgi:hypothetical protein